MIIGIISDGKKGHLVQTQGLAQALIEQAAQKQPEKEHRWIELNIQGKSWWSKFRYKAEASTPKLDLVLCAGHSTHLAALSLAKKHDCPCMVCMKPSLPSCLFALCLIPLHDLKKGKNYGKHILPIQGALNNIRPNPDAVKKHVLFLIGGPSKEFEWESETLSNQIALIARHSKSPMKLTTSRRTPEDFAADISHACPNIRVEPVEQTHPNWVRENIDAAKEVWVTQDSVSMVYEALSSGAPVGILDMPPKRRISRVTRGLHGLLEEGVVGSFAQWAQSHQLPQHKALNEAARAAEYILTHYPQILS